MASVRAVAMEAPGRVRVREFPFPHIDADSALVRMEYSGLCATDLHMYTGHLSGVEFPVIPGHENVGVIAEIGKEAARRLEVTGASLTEGDRVTWVPYVPCGECWYCRWAPSNLAFLCDNRKIAYGETNCKRTDFAPWLFGGWAEYVVLKPGTWVYKIPESLDSRIAVLLDTLVSVRGVERAMAPLPAARAGFGFGDTVVIQGSGPIGLLAAVKARVCGGGRIIMIGAPEERLQLARLFGVDETISLDTHKTPEARTALVFEMTGGIGADAVFECVGLASAVPEGIRMVRRQGTYVIIGCYADSGAVQIHPHEILQKDLTILGQRYAAPQQYRKDLGLLERFQTTFPFGRLITKVYPLERADEALQSKARLADIKSVFSPLTET